MSSWGPFTYDNDEVMDRVGDIWKDVFDRLSIDLISRTIEESFGKRGNDDAANLWKMCTIELSEDRIRRLGFLSTPDPHVAKDILSKIDRQIFDDAVLRCVQASPEHVVTGVVSYFVRELGHSIEPELRQRAIRNIREEIAHVRNPDQKGCLELELLCLES